MPKDPVMLLSFVNTSLRDKGIGLEELCKSFGVDVKEIEEKLDKIGYTYNNELNKFV
ncbi:MAG: DUF4250 domain-containing protein [Lachnospiraceae bacterium]|nr:DUF4250 domain-containing protein [Lachnospiraceae bacterium]MBR3600198.1 DUF4250 domain-containing protein [Lachnospiraceae bacterium]